MLRTSDGALVCKLGAVMFSAPKQEIDGSCSLPFTAQLLEGVPQEGHAYQLVYGKRAYSAVLRTVEQATRQVSGRIRNGQRLRVLLLDEIPDDQGLFIEAFREEDLAIEVTALYDPAHALLELELTAGTAQRYGLLLVDPRVDEQAAREMLKRIRVQPKHRGMHVAVMLPSMRSSLVNEYRLLGVEYFIAKPSDWHSYQDLASQVRNAVVQYGQPSPWGVLAIGPQSEQTGPAST